MNLKTSGLSFLIGLLQCLGGAYMLASPAPVYWSELFTVKFVFAVLIFSISNGILAHKSFRDPNARTRDSDSHFGFDDFDYKKEKK